MSEGSGENLALLGKAGGADVALLQGGLGSSASQIQMLATLFYEPLWIFVRKDESLDQINRLAGRTIAAGHPGSGTAAVFPRSCRPTAFRPEIRHSKR